LRWQNNVSTNMGSTWMAKSFKGIEKVFILEKVKVYILLSVAH